MAEKREGMQMSGFCLWPGIEDPERSHTFCTTKGCDCTCHQS